MYIIILLIILTYTFLSYCIAAARGIVSKPPPRRRPRPQGHVIIMLFYHYVSFYSFIIIIIIKTSYSHFFLPIFLLWGPSPLRRRPCLQSRGHAITIIITPGSHSKISRTKICSKGWVAQKTFQGLGPKRRESWIANWV